jgi:hypothetical protein
MGVAQLLIHSANVSLMHFETIKVAASGNRSGIIVVVAEYPVVTQARRAFRGNVRCWLQQFCLYAYRFCFKVLQCTKVRLASTASAAGAAGAAP